MNIFQIIAIGGMLSPIIYTLMWIIGGHLESGYSHVRQDVSTLVSVGAPNKKLLDKFIMSSSVLLLIFYTGLHWGVNNGEGSPLGPILFLIGSILSVLVAFLFPLDEGGKMTTTKGKLHLALIGVAGLLTTMGMVAMWFRLESVASWTEFATFSLITAIASFVLVILTSIATNTNYLGLVERFMVSSYQIYYFVLAMIVFLTNV